MQVDDGVGPKESDGLEAEKIDGESKESVRCGGRRARSCMQSSCWAAT